MTNRIGGDYSYEALEAFRNAYASQMMAPEEMDTDRVSGMPTSNISNTSPWHGHVGTWKYPSGRGPDSDLKQPFNPESYLPSRDDDDDEMTDKEMEEFFSTLSTEELDAILADIEAEGFEEGEVEPDEDNLSDDEIDNLIDEIFAGDEG